MTADSTVACVADVHAVLGEGPVWVAREAALYWVDIKGRKIFRLDERRRAAANGRRRSASARLRRARAAASSPGPSRASPRSTSTRSGSRSSTIPKRICPTTASTTARSTARAASGRGRWTIPRRRRRGTLYRLDAGPGCDARSTRATRSPTGRRSARRATSCTTMIRRGRSTYAFDLDADGNASNRRVFAQYRRRRRLSRRDDGRCRRLPVDRLLGRLVRAPLFAGGRVPRDDRRAGAAADQLRVRRAGSRPALHHLGKHRPDDGDACRCNLMPGVCLCCDRASRGIAELPFAG